MARLWITIDTEADSDLKWRRKYPFTYSSIREGIPELLRPIFERYGVKPIYFVSPEVLHDESSCEVLRHERERGAILGAHLHPEYLDPQTAMYSEVARPSNIYPSNLNTYEEKYQALASLSSLIEARFGERPLWYRAGRYGIDLDSIRALSKLGFRYDSSITPGIDWSPQGGPDHRPAPPQPYWVSPRSLYQGTTEAESLGIQEVPITISGPRFPWFSPLLSDKWYFYRWLRPTHMTVREQKAVVDEFTSRWPSSTLVLSFHSNEIMPNCSPYVRNAWMQRRFLVNLERVIEYCKKKEIRL